MIVLSLYWFVRGGDCKSNYMWTKVSYITHMRCLLISILFNNVSTFFFSLLQPYV